MRTHPNGEQATSRTPNYDVADICLTHAIYPLSMPNGSLLLAASRQTSHGESSYTLRVCASPTCVPNEDGLLYGSLLIRRLAIGSKGRDGKGRSHLSDCIDGTRCVAAHVCPFSNHVPFYEQVSHTNHHRDG